MTEDSIDVYANSVSVTTSVYDAILVFGTRTAVSSRDRNRWSRSTKSVAFA
jgi:hypothetical protein